MQSHYTLSHKFLLNSFFVGGRGGILLTLLFKSSYLLRPKHEITYCFTSYLTVTLNDMSIQLMATEQYVG